MIDVRNPAKARTQCGGGRAGLFRSIDEMEDDTFELYLKYHFAVCERVDLAGITSHALDIFKK